MILYIYANNIWREKQYTDYNYEYASDIAFDNSGKLVLLSVADSGSLYISSFDDNYETRTVRPACAHVSSGPARLAFLADDSPFIIFQGFNYLTSCVYVPWADNWYIDTMLSLPSGYSQEIVQDTNGYVVITAMVTTPVIYWSYYTIMRKQYGLWHYNSVADLDGHRYRSYPPLELDRFADGRVYMLVLALNENDDHDLDTPFRLQLYETGPWAHKPWVQTIDVDFVHYREKVTYARRTAFAMAPNGTLGVFVIYNHDDPFVEGQFDLFGVYSEYRDGEWNSELVEYPDYTGIYYQEDLILDYDSQNRPGLAVHVDDGSIYFLWRNLE